MSAISTIIRHEIVTIGEAARILGASRYRVRQLIDQRRIEAQKCGRVWFLWTRSVARSTKGDVQDAIAAFTKLLPAERGVRLKNGAPRLVS